MWALTVSGTYIAYLAVTGQSALQVGRLEAGELNTIQTGRAIAHGLIWVTLIIAMRKGPLLLAAPAAAFAIVLVGTGSRGPLAGAALALLVALLWRAGNATAMLKRVALASAFAVALYVGYARAPDVARDRLLVVGDSGSNRMRYFEASWEVIKQNPFGVGWGDWKQAVGIAAPADTFYPHNLILEASSEAGWLAGAALTWFIIRTLRSALRNCRGLHGRTALALCLFSTVSMLVSDDLLGAKVFFASCAIVLARESWSFNENAPAATEVRATNRDAALGVRAR